MKRGICLAAIWALAGCTAVLWEEDYKVVHVPAGGDRIHAFGVAGAAARGQLAPGDLAMMGEKYWYVISHTRAGELVAVLKSGLPARFRIFNEEGQETPALRVEVGGLGQNEFYSDFCLRYPADASVKDRLEALDFYQRKGGDYERCFVARGWLYSSPKQVGVDYRFESVVPVALFKEEWQPRGGVGRTIGKALLTPVAVAADAVGAVTVYPAAVLAIEAGGGLNIGW